MYSWILFWFHLIVYKAQEMEKHLEVFSLAWQLWNSNFFDDFVPFLYNQTEAPVLRLLSFYSSVFLFLYDGHITLLRTTFNFG